METRNLLKSLQGNYLRALVGAMRTTPTEALETALCIPPLDLVIICNAQLTAYRLKCQGEWIERRVGHSNLKIFLNRPFTLKQDRIPRKYQVVKAFKASLPTREDWSKLKPLSHPGTDMWFTDGSGCNGRFGAGVYNRKLNFKASFPLGEWATVFQAEVAAILECVNFQISNEVRRKNIYIFSDNRAAIGALMGTTTTSAIVWDCMQALQKLSESNKITLIWVPGHQGIQGNEEADRLAKLGTQEEPVNWPVGVPFSVGRSFIRKGLERGHLLSWSSGQGCRRSRLLMPQPLPKRAAELLAMSRGRLRLSIGLLTGHWAFRAHLFNLKLVEHNLCRHCGEESEDNLHILCYCPALAFKRFSSLGSMFLEPSELCESRIAGLCGLADKAGLNFG